VRLSAPAAHYRVKALERDGVISGYGARLSAAAIGAGLSGIVAVEIDGSLATIVAALEDIREIEACWSTAGVSDILLRVRSRDALAMERLLVRIREIPGVVRTRSTILLATQFSREADPVPLLAGAGTDPAKT